MFYTLAHQHQIGNQTTCAHLPGQVPDYLNAANRAQYKDSSVQHSKCTLNLNGEVHMTRRVNDVDVGVFPFAKGSR